LAHLLGTCNQQVCKYIAKTVAFLSLRNGKPIFYPNKINILTSFLDKYKPILLEGDGARALVSIIALLPQTDDGSNRLKTLCYYLARDNAAAVSHVCCAMVGICLFHRQTVINGISFFFF
jgi:hypothetical protein